MVEAISVAERTDRYVRLQDAGTREARGNANAALSRDYYDLVTGFYELGWGESFHFAPLAKGEPHKDALLRAEHRLALRAGVDRASRVLDVGCGIGGPMRSIARLTEARICGLNNNAYQVKRAQTLNRRTELDALCDVVEGDFFAMPFTDASFDVAYDFEATCHASPRRVDCFREVHRVLAPGGRFATFQWCMTDRFDPTSVTHLAIKRDLEKGNGLADIDSVNSVLTAMRDAGFDVVETRDYAQTGDPDRPWYSPLAADISLTGFLKTRVGTAITHRLVRLLEAARISPEGLSSAHAVLLLAQRALILAGRAGIFTPMLFVLGEKPDVQRSN